MEESMVMDKEINKVESREEAVSPRILLFLYNTNYYKIENDRYTKNEVQQNPKTLHRINSNNFRKEMILKKLTYIIDIKSRMRRL